MTNKYYYPVVFQREEDGFSVWLSDIDGCISQGDTFEEAVENIKDAFGLYAEEYREEGKELPAPSSPENMRAEKGQFVAVIEFDLLDYMKKNSSRSVKKTLSIPEWLNTLAEDEQINFSAVLQQALKEKLRIN